MVVDKVKLFMGELSKKKEDMVCIQASLTSSQVSLAGEN